MKRLSLNFILCASLMFVFAAVAGCGRNTEATKQEAPEGIDWEAIENEGADMADSQSKGE